MCGESMKIPPKLIENVPKMEPKLMTSARKPEFAFLERFLLIFGRHFVKNLLKPGTLLGAILNQKSKKCIPKTMPKSMPEKYRRKMRK
jgi:hypothetical protein